MTQRQLDRAIAQATGDDLATIRRRGFSVLSAQPDALDDDELPPPQMLDWDELDEMR